MVSSSLCGQIIDRACHLSLRTAGDAISHYLEKSIAEKKASLKAFKQSIEDLKTKLHALAQDLCEIRPEFDEKLEECSKEFEDLEYLLQEIKTLEENPLLKDMRTIEEVEAELEAQVSQVFL